MPQIDPETDKIIISSLVIMLVKVILIVTVFVMGMIIFWTKNLEANV